MTSPINLTGVAVRLNGRNLLDAVSLTAESGEILAIVGPNGAGKSTLLRVMTGDVALTEGVVRVGGRDPHTTTLREMSMLRAYLGPRGVPDIPFTVRDVVAMGRHPHRRTQLAPEEHDAIVESALEATDVHNLAERRVDSLSTGERQRVGLARVISQETPIVLLDEPTSALDIGHQESVMKLLAGLKTANRTVLTVLHDLNLAAAHADRLLVLHHGMVQALGPPEEVLDEGMLEEVYAQRMRVIPHPERNCPLVVTLDNEDPSHG